MQLMPWCQQQAARWPGLQRPDPPIALACRVQEATESPPSDEEVARAKDETLNQFVFQFASPAGQLQVDSGVLGIYGCWVC